MGTFLLHWKERERERKKGIWDVMDMMDIRGGGVPLRLLICIVIEVDETVKLVDTILLSLGALFSFLFSSRLALALACESFYSSGKHAVTAALTEHCFGV